MNRFSRSGLLIALLLAFGASGTLAQPAASPVGQWRTIDDESGQARSIVEIYEKDGALRGKVVEILRASDEAQRNSEGQVICTACEGERKNQPVEGMVILWGLEKDGDEWTGGNIIDPENGNTYSAKMGLDGADRLDVRGYRGVSLFGRTQTWQRVTADS
ncbi:MAG: DUF2147 domain-containing protein [Bacteroidetes bacterium QS_9_68_14]|nr:MAG: DUF2147 domain-containing protein [Bacteroidetes bacterium QS_9_68_14]